MPKTNLDNAARTPASKGLWSASIAVACAISWLAYNFPPKNWRIPDDMVYIGALSPPEDQARLATVVKANLWKNTLLKFSLAGLGMGTASLVLFGRTPSRNWSKVLTSLGSGLVAGALAGSIGLLVRQIPDREYEIPFISYESRPMFCDSVVFSVISTLLLVPVGWLLFSELHKAERSRAFAAVVAGVLTGLLVPFIAALVLHANTTTSFFPPVGYELTAIWFGVLTLMTVLFCVLRGSPNRKPATPGEMEAV